MSRFSRIDVVIATASAAHVVRLIASLTHHLVGFDLRIHLLLFGAGQRELSQQIPSHVKIFHRQSGYPDIAANRNMCQRYLQEQMLQNNSLGLVLDDDLVWTLSGIDWATLLQRLQSVNADMAFLGMAGDAPIPAEYTRAAPTLDVLLAIVQQRPHTASNQLRVYCEQAQACSLADSEHLHWHHDYYSYTLPGFRSAKLDLNQVRWPELVNHLYVGKKTTRSVNQLADIKPATGRERGGATLVLNPHVLDISNTSMILNGWTSRRSDMLMAMEARKMGYQLFVTPQVVRHEREVCFDSFAPGKLLGDLLGYALVEAGQQPFEQKIFHDHLSRRTMRTLWLVEQTYLQLGFLHEWLELQQLSSVAIDAAVNRLQAYNCQLVKQLQVFLLGIERDQNVYKRGAAQAQGAFAQ